MSGRTRSSVVAAGVAVVLALVPAAATTSAAFSGQTEAVGDFTAAETFCETPGTWTLQATADASVSQDLALTNFGSSIELQVRSLIGGNRMTLIRFSLPALGHCRVQTAVLRVHALSVVAGRTIEIHRMASAWEEATVTWNTRPASSGSFVPATSGLLEWNQKDVTGLVDAMYANGNHGFGLRDAEPDSLVSILQVYSSREGLNPPELVLTLG